MATTTKQRLALAICDFLSTSLKDGTLSSDESDSIDVAINCIGESFKVDPSDAASVSAATGAQNLLQIYGVYEKLKGTSTNTSTSSSTSASTSNNPEQEKTPTDAEKAQAEDLKAKGNRAMAAKDYPTAIDLYTQALSLSPRNAVYLSNRAAAYSAARDHGSARADAERAVQLDPKYTKAWSRLGLARFALGDARGSMDAYRQGIEHEGSGGSEAMKKGFETARKRVEDLEAEAADSASSPAARGGPGASAGGGMPDLGGLASLLGGAGGGNREGGGGGGGMPDLGSIMSNPMFANMAQSLMSNPEMMQNLMSNPRLREMADRFSSGGGGGMPDLSTLMNDPNIADMARNMMGGGGGAGRGAGNQ
ncbi:hypothetical protein F4821DRAFT_239776 [Hypoxylon rubiginosum]|uniref:Uncharacterized protein n=1 Tax=Hypoxylon rubiginosum TaxID=110542 RepID=A0ACC0CZL2_9PEZI|nr:hypothetical protein F4821DRAFT_239776 [Hypoxylon rubiginosum]